MRYLLPLMLVGCSVAPCYEPNGRLEMTSMEVKVTRTSELGFGIDDPSNELNDTRVNRTIQNVLRCLDEIEPLTKDEKAVAWCTGKWDAQVRSCLVVKEAPVWRVSVCSGSQVFSCNAPAASCLAKGQQPSEECPCACRASVQDNSTIVVTPNLELLPWRFVELVTGCDQIQNVPRLSACGSVSMVDQSI